MTLLTDFLEGAPHGTATALAALACAESLTDGVALAIYELAPVPGLGAEDFVSAFKYSGLTEPRNSEWSLAPSLRRELISSPSLEREFEETVHRLLLSIAQDDANRMKAGSEVPSYLFTEAGMAYHLAGAGEIRAALDHYSAVSRGPFTGSQWLGAKLAEEQERTKVIPDRAVETTFLRAWVMQREGRRQDAMPLFRQVAATDREKREVAISLHITGNDHNRGQRREAEQELRRSIAIGRKLDNEFHVAQTLRSLANFLSRHHDRSEEAEDAYRQSIDLGRKLDNEFHVAQTLHSLANLLRKHDDRFQEVKDAYELSIEIDRKLDNQFGVAQALHSLANLLSRHDDRFEEAENAYRRSIAIGRKLDDQFGVAQTMHSLANLLSKYDDRLGEAEEAYKESLELGQKLRNDNHVAQVLRSYALAVEGRSFAEAIVLLQRSLDINRRRGNARFAHLVEGTIKEVQERARMAPI